MNSELKMIIKREEYSEVKKEQPNIYKNIIIGYKECMPGVNETLLDYRFYMNNHMLNKDFETNPKYFIAFDDSNLNTQGIVAISALYVFPKHRKNGYARELISNIKYIAQRNIILQIAVNEQKYKDLKIFYEKMDFQTTGKLGKADMLGLKYIDLFWCINPIKLSYTPNGTKIDRS